MKWLRWLAYGLVGIVLLVAAVAVAGYTMLLRTVPPHEGHAIMAGLERNARIVRDENGLPHVEASSHADAARALGYLHASERMWQMEVMRMAGQGRLSEMFGQATVSSDLFLKTLNIEAASRSSADGLDGKTTNILQAYAEGVNAWLERKTSTFEPSLPVEYILTGLQPEPWEPWHSVSILKVMALSLDSNMDEEIARLALAGKGFSPREIEEIFPASDRDTPPRLPDLRLLYGFGIQGKEQRADRSAGQAEETMLATAPWRLQLPASNNWAISGSKTESGIPLLANDPHLGLTAPSSFFLAHLSFQEDGRQHDIAGGMLPGVPAVFSGHNKSTAWGLTTTYLDAQDIFLERVDPDDPSRYRTQDGFESFVSEEVTIRVKGGDDVTFTRRKSRHGPILPDGFRQLGERLPEGHVAALAWTALEDGDTTMAGAVRIGLEDGVEAFVENLRLMRSPMQSIVVADRDGNIGLVAAGRMPKRSRFNRVAGRAPVPGWMDLFAWEGYLPFDEQPIVINPPSGALATANANWLPPDYRGHVTLDWPPPFRQLRVEELYVRSNRVHSIETMLEGQADTLSRAMQRLRDEGLAQMPQGVRINEEIINALQAWDGHMRADRPEPMIMTAWHRNLQNAMLKDELGNEFALVEKGSITRMLNMLTSAGARNWCDRTDTPGLEDCGSILFDSLAAALDELEAAQGENWRKWRWGTAHVTRHEHRPFSQVDALSSWFTIRRVMDGGTYTLLRNSNHFDEDDPYAGRHGSAFRGIYDLSDPDASLFIISTGQSGHFLSDQYDDQADRWARMEYLPLPVSPLLYRNGREKVFVLETGR